MTSQWDEGATRIALITGRSGAGRSTAIKAFEDLGYEAIDNLPLAVLKRVVEPSVDGDGGARTSPARIAIGVDTRTRGFSAAALIDIVAGFRRNPGLQPVLLYLDCTEDVLLSRFKETRRRHPLAPEEPVAEGIAREAALLAQLREQADLVIDTSQMGPHDLRNAVADRFADAGGARLALSVQSFAFKRGAPRDADMTLDCRFLRNPYWEPELRALDGRDPRIEAFVAADPLFDPFMTRLADMLTLLLPAYRREGKSYFCISLGCTGGRHRSVVASLSLGAMLGAAGWPAMLRHRELEDARPDARQERGGRNAQEGNAA